MHIFFKNEGAEELHPEKKIIFLCGIILTVLFSIILRQYGFNHITIELITGLPLIGLLIFSFEPLFILWIFSLFLNYDALMLKVVTLLTIPLLISYLITARELNFRSFKNALSFPLIIYILTMLPSFINTINIPLSIYLMFNLFAMAIVYHIMGERIETKDQIKKYLNIFIILCVINGIYVIFQYLTTHYRAFGFSGIVYVDYSAMAILASLIISVFNKGTNKYLPLILTFFLLTALLFTQTRNTFISLGIAFLFFILYLVKEYKLFSINRKKVIITFIIIAIISAFFIGAFIVYSPSVFKRFNDLTAYKQMFVVENSTVGINSSIVTRALIWLTALNAFIAHPIIGIGAFSFPFSSHLYCTIPQILFKLYVEGLSTHITFLSTLTETGIIGATGFLIFMLSSLKISFRAIKFEQSIDERIVSTIIAFLQLYIFISMFMTDAWLWGQCGMLWGFILGLSVANYKILANRAAGQNV